MSGATATLATSVRYTNPPNLLNGDNPVTPVWAQLDLDNSAFAGSTGTGAGPWLSNPTKNGLAHVHSHMLAAGACSFTIEGSGDPANGSGGPVTLFTSSGVVNSSGDVGDAGQFQCTSPYIRVNRQSNTGTNLVTLSVKP